MSQQPAQPSIEKNDYRPPVRRGPAHPGKIEKAKDPRQALLRLLPFLAPYKVSIAFVIVLVVIYTLLGLAGPYLMGQAIDGFIATKDPVGLARIALLMMAVYLLSAGAETSSNWIMARVSQSALKTVRRDLFNHLQFLPLKYFDNHPAGELMSRLTNDIDAINQAVSQNVVALVASVLSLGGILVAMFVLNFWLALASIFVVPIMLWFTNFVAKYTRKGFRELQKSLGKLTGVMEEAISGQRVVKAFRRNESIIAAFREHNQEVFKSAVYANSFAMMLMPLTNVLGNFFVIVLAGLGGWLALQGLVTVGTIATFISYGRNFINPLRQLANMYNAIQAALAGAERVFEILDTPAEVDVPAAERANGHNWKGHVRFDAVDFSYVAGTPIIKNMTLEAQPGQTVALVGPTGAGKTTLINLLTRFYEIDGGQISIDEQDIRGIPKPELRRRLGLVLQDTFLFGASVMDNIRYGRLDATDEECIEAAKLADADYFICRLPQGYQTVLSERAGNLSQGQRQLLAITRAILADPDILILDEATSSVDTRTEARIQHSLLRLMEGRTSFVIAHRLSTIRDADQLLVIRDGEIVERGNHQALLDQRGFYYQLYMSQFKGEAI
jgi:ATP-binding cassette, subfamily B, multidrug efflux pump